MDAKKEDIDMQIINNILLGYFSSFARKDFSYISEFFDSNIELIDWNGTWEGSLEVENQLNSIVDNSDIVISPLAILLSQDDNHIHATCIIDIVTNGNITKVVDIIRFSRCEDDSFVITKINAFKQ